MAKHVLTWTATTLFLRKGLDLDITTPLLSSRRMTYLYEPDTVHSLVYAGSFIVREESPCSFSIYDSEEEDDPELILHMSASSAPSNLSHQDVVLWTSEPKPYIPGKVISGMASPDIFVDPQCDNPFLTVIHLLCAICGRFIPCSSSAPCHAPVFCPDCYGGLLDSIFTTDMPSS